VPQSPLLPFLERKAGLITYIGADWNVYTMDQAGRNVTAYTKDAVVPKNSTDAFRYYVYPTFSADGDRLAFVGVSGQGTINSADLYIANVEGDAKKVYSSKNEHPFFLYWSPDNTTLGFLSSTSDGQSMILQSISSDSKDRTVIDTGTPYYWSWAPDGKTMIVHSGSAQSTVPEHLAFLRVGSDITEDGLDATPASFQSPAWSPDGSHILMTRLNVQNKKSEIIMTDGRGKYEKTIGSFDLNTAFAWSHQGDKVAYIEGKKTIGAGVLGELHVVDLETSKDLFKGEQDVFAFFWSPNDEKIAYFIPKLLNSSSSSGGQSDSNSQSGQQLALQLKMLDVKSGESKELFTFQPSEQFTAILPYFDQYSQSATIWSPDNNNLVLSFVAGDGTPGIAVVAASGQLEPRILTQGYLAFWSRK
jgi:Tol biopolymer transport system component